MVRVKDFLIHEITSQVSILFPSYQGGAGDYLIGILHPEKIFIDVWRLELLS